MLTEITIDNFRGIRHLEVPHLPQVTLLAGRNGSGKTTLLEAVFALCARTTPTWIVNLQAIRGFGQLSDSGAQYAGLFYGFKDHGVAKIQGRAGHQHLYRVELECTPSLQTTALTTASTAAGAGGHNPYFICRAFCDGDIENESSLRWASQGAVVRPEIKGAKSAEPPAQLLHPGTGGAIAEDTAQAFGEAKAAGRADAITSGLKIMDSSIEDVEFLLTRAGAQFYAKRQGHRDPLGLLGGGVNNVCRYLIYLASSHGGFVGIDEVENGLHHSVLPDIFRIFVAQAVNNNIHVVMSTHSEAAVLALSKAAEGYMGDQRKEIGVMNIQRLQDDRLVLTPFFGDELISAVKLGYEIR